jgi:hypothetical protein
MITASTCLHTCCADARHTTTASLGRGSAIQAVQLVFEGNKQGGGRGSWGNNTIAHAPGASEEDWTEWRALAACRTWIARTVGLAAMPVPEDLHCNRPYSSRPFTPLRVLCMLCSLAYQDGRVWD